VTFLNVQDNKGLACVIHRIALEPFTVRMQTEAQFQAVGRLFLGTFTLMPPGRCVRKSPASLSECCISFVSKAAGAHDVLLPVAE
jgi:hypothetical protein